MTIPVQPPPEEQHMLETAVDNRTPYGLGQDLFGNGSLAPMPTDSLKRQIREKLRAKSRQLSDKQIAMFKALADKPDEDIDLSDIPEAGDDAWKNAVPGEFYRPIKQ